MNRTDKRDSGVPRKGTQRSVAELLARYGEPTSGGRRHRRRATDTRATDSRATDSRATDIEGSDIEGSGIESTAPKSIISRIESGRIESDSGTRPRPAQPSYRRGADPARTPHVSPSPTAPPRSHGAGPHGPAVRGRRAAPREPQDRTPTEDARLDPSLRDPALAPTPLPGAGRPRRGEPPAGLAARPGGAVIALGPGDAAPPASVPEPATAVPDSDEQAGYDGEEPEDDLSSAREWAVVAGQVGLGVVGGAALWLVCEWLWQSVPVLALVVALLVITSLVWVVRYVRRTEDLQTTVIAVLVGLFVTVSPAALLLVGR